MPQLPLGVLASELAGSGVPNPGDGPVPLRRSDASGYGARGHVCREVVLGLPVLLPLCGGMVALLLGRAEVHPLGHGVPGPVEHGGLLVLSDGMQSTDELRVVEEIPPGC